MPLVAGSRVGPYEIVALIGSGGMGEVYRARDTQLDRDVAIKILPDAVAGDPDRLMRFEREAKTLATLNHPHIAQIHGLEHLGTTRALVMELAEGEDLRQQIARGALAIDDALSIARQIADALEAAHDRGIVHRDLKPANIKVAADGNVKVLDFGLAKAIEDGTETSVSNMSSPTITSPTTTRAGVILGTAAYMSPEQARGRVVDKRTDIWAFGVVLYEMLTARRAFDGETVSDTLAVLLTRDVDLSALPRDTPATVRRLLARCLTRDTRMRLRDIGEARIALSGATPEVAAPAAPPPHSSRPWPWLAGAAVAGAAIALAGISALTSPASSPSRPVMHLSIPLSPKAPLSNSGAFVRIALSPDGTRLAYVGRTDTVNRLFIRNLSQLDFNVVAGSEDARGPFFSPDGQWLGFTVAGRLRKIPVGGGSPTTLAEFSGVPAGARWNDDDSIVFARGPLGLFSVPAAGGAARPLIAPDRAAHESWLSFPQVLPSGAGLLFTLAGDSIASFDDAQVVVETAGRPETRRILVGGTSGRYLQTGHLVFGHNGRLMAAPLDLAQQRLTGAALPILDGVSMSPATGVVNTVTSDTGTLAYVPGPLMDVGPDNLVVIDRSGVVTTLSPPYGFFLDEMSVSPDGRRVAIRAAKANDDLHVYDSLAGTFSRLTLDAGDEQNPVWTPDGKRIVYSSTQGGNLNLYWRIADGSSAPERLLQSLNELRASSISPDGKLLAYTERHPETGHDIWILPLNGERTPRPVLRTPFQERLPSFSPDGEWLAYESDEPGRSQVYVMRFPDGRDRRQISVDGGTEPLWSTDGRELYFLNSGVLMVASPGSGSRLAPPKRLFQYAFGAGLNGRKYAVRPDGRFVTVAHGNTEPIREIRLILNWFEDLKARVPIK